jgi:hypothetical protein
MLLDTRKKNIYIWFIYGFRRSCKDKVFFKENAKSRSRKSLKNYWAGILLQYAHLHNVIFHCIKKPKDLGGVEKTKLKGQMDNSGIA